MTARLIHRGRFSAAPEGEFVVFLIGMRFNKPWKLQRWLPVLTAMPRMLELLATHPELGCLGSHTWLGRTTITLQYWRSFQDLEAFAQRRDLPHLDAWQRFNRAVRASGDVGIWHETYRASAGMSEAFYANMPAFGLAAATRHVPVSRVGQSAAARLGASDAVPRIAPY